MGGTVTVVETVATPTKGTLEEACNAVLRLCCWFDIKDVAGKESEDEVDSAGGGNKPFATREFKRTEYGFTGGVVTELVTCDADPTNDEAGGGPGGRGGCIILGGCEGSNGRLLGGGASAAAGVAPEIEDIGMGGNGATGTEGNETVVVVDN